MRFKLVSIFSLIHISINSISAQNVEPKQLMLKSELYYKDDTLFTGHFRSIKETCPYKNGESNLIEEGNIILGKKEGDFVFKNSKGEIIGGGKYLDNKKEGSWIDVIWTIIGDCGINHWKSFGNYHLGKKEGYWKEQSKQDNYAEGNYVDGKKEGKWIEVRRGPEIQYELIKHEGCYLNGKKNGEWKSFYYDDKSSFENYPFGKIVLVMNYNADSLEGKYIHYYPTKKKCIYEEGEFKDNKKTGVWKTYDKEHRNESIGAYTNGKKDMEWIYYFAGKEVSKEFFDEGKLVKIISYRIGERGERIETEHIMNKKSNN